MIKLDNLDPIMDVGFLLHLINSTFSNLPSSNSKRIYKWCYSFYEKDTVNNVNNHFPVKFIETFKIKLEKGVLENDFNLFNGLIVKMIESFNFQIKINLGRIINLTNNKFRNNIHNDYVIGHSIMNDHKLSYIFYSVLSRYVDKCILVLRRDNKKLSLLKVLKNNIIKIQKNIINCLVVDSVNKHRKISSSAVALGKRKRN